MELLSLPLAIPSRIRRLAYCSSKSTLFKYAFCWFYLFYFFSSAIAQPREHTCPARCRCVHVEGRLTADCSSAGLTAVPGPFPAGAMIVRFDNNPVNDSKWLQQAHYFVKLDRFAVDWIELSLRSCNIRGFRPELFWGLPNLNKLILSRNKLTKVPTIPETPTSQAQQLASPFRDMAKLKVLDLSHNQLTVLVRKNFNGAVSLEDVDLSSNEITHIHADAFSGLPKLRTIDLTNNKLNLVDRLSFSRLPHLKQLHLTSNPFECDCRLKGFVEWQRDKYIVQPPKCAFPEKLRDKPWNHLKVDEFACAPKLTPGSSGKKAIVNVGLSITLQCKISGLPEPRLVWEFHNATQTVVILNTPGKYELKKTSIGGCQFYDQSASRTSQPGCTWLHALRIVGVGPSDIGVYHCKATNPADTQYLVFQLDLDRGQIVQQVTGNGSPPVGSSTHQSEQIKELEDEEEEAVTVEASSEKATEPSTSVDIIMIGLILGASILVIIALLLAVLCYRRAVNKSGHSGTTRSNSGAQSGGGSLKPKAVNGYGYHIIDNTGAGATSPGSLGVGDGSATTSLRSPASPAVVSSTSPVNPVEKPPRTHVENFYSEQPSAMCDFHRRQLEQQRRQNSRPFDDSRTGLIHAEGDDSGFSDPEAFFYQHNRSATLPYQRNHQSEPVGSRTPGQRVLRPAIDDPLLEKKLLLTRRNSDGGGGCCIGHAHSAVAHEQDHTMPPIPASPQAELRETAL